MDVIVNVVNQKLKVATNLKTFVEGTQEFIRFIFKLSNDWDSLTTFAQFRQDGNAYNVYLNEDCAAYLPPEIKHGTCTLMLYGSGGTTIGTTNYLELMISESNLVSDAQSTNISISLYNQLVNMVDELSDKITQIEEDGVTTDQITAAVQDELNSYLESGKLANMTIADRSISRTKVDADFEATLLKTDTAMQPSVYDPQGIKADIFAYTQTRVNSVQSSVNSLQTRVNTVQNTVNASANKVDAMYNNYTVMEANIEGLQGSVNSLDNNVATINNKVNIVENSVNIAENNIATLNDTVNIIKDDIIESNDKISANLSSVQSEIVNARSISETITYSSLGEAVRGVYQLSKQYTDGQLTSYSPYDILIVDELPTSGEAFTYYLVSNESGTKYDKYWWITDADGNGKWDVFGGSSTEVVAELPELGESDVDYILNSADGCLYYKWIDGEWRIVAGSLAVVVSELPESGNEFTDYYMANENNEYSHYRYIDGTFYQIGTNSYGKEYIDEKISGISNSISNYDERITTNESSIDSMGKALTNLQQAVNNIDTEGYTYYATYGTATLVTGEEADNVMTLYEVKDDIETVKSQFVIAGGGGGSAPTTTLVVEKITQSPIISTVSDKVEIQINYSSTDSDGEPIDGTYTWKSGNTTLSSGTLVQGLNTFDMTEYTTVGTQKFTLTVADEGGSVVVKSWTVQVVDIRIESSFNDRITYNIGRSVNFTYTPHGSISKTVHFILDGVELDPVVTSNSGISQSYTLAAQEHGAHLLECYITATVNNEEIETDHIFKDIIWYDENSTEPVIGCIYRKDYYGAVPARQYGTTLIPYYVYDPATATPTVTRSEDGEIVSTHTMPTYSDTWSYKTSDVGVHTLEIACKNTVVVIELDVEELGVDVSPVVSNLAFDFNPIGKSNGSENRLWSDEKDPDIAMSVSDNFDWTNGGYQLDADGNQYFCVKAGTTATISYNLFEADASVYGLEFKTIFKVSNVRDVDAIFLDCQSDETAVGLQMGAHAAYFKSSASSLYMPYSEEDIIEFEFNINVLDTEKDDSTAVIMSYEDGVGARPMIYDATHRLYQYAPVPIVIGSPDCDVHIYRMKAYSSALTDSDILSNFIADARDPETMLDRYYRNKIYNENNALTPESVAAACPDLKIIKIDCPYFTQDKNEMIKNTSVECIHKNGDAILDNWKAVNCYHSGQGTTSNEYGDAGRNLNLYMCFDGEYQHKNVTYDPGYITQLTLGDGTKYADGTGKVALTRTSVPNAIFNIKVNIASSENANNALLQKRFHRFLPYTTVASKRDSNAKTTMEFANCVVFVRENNTDLSTHREFQNTDWNFYAIGNIGDSKDTDFTRVNDPDDHNEFVIEIADNTKPNSIFPTGIFDEGGKMVYPIDKGQWVPGNPAYDSLHTNWDETYEFRYEHANITDEESSANAQIWNDFYEWIITASDEQFVNELGDWTIEDASLYMYLFTERYTMIDNRAKNTFWHWGKVYISDTEAATIGEEKASWFTIDNEKAAIHNGYRFDFWDYDNDTALGINNSGEMTMTYGKEDTDYRTDGDPNSGYIFNAAESVFFCRIRDLMYGKLQAMYLSRETAGAWSSEGLIAEFDNWQNQFPEELWRLDIIRKYDRTYQNGIKRFLETMMNGRKKYQRRQWERDQDPYMGTKYVSASVKADQIMFRCNTPQNAVVAPNYDLSIIPYADMYINVLYGNSSAPMRVRAKAGTEYKILNPLTASMDDTAILIYNCSRIQALNDLSGCYIHDNDFSKATKLQRLIIGNSVDGYSNAFLTTLNIGNNFLLKELNVRNCPNLVGSVNLSNCGNLELLYAEGTSITGVMFAPNGKIISAYLPNTITTLSMRNLNYLTDLQMSYDNLEQLTIENSIVDDLAIVQDSADILETLRVVGVDWELPDTTLLNTILEMNSSVLIGDVHISGAIRYHELELYESAWPDLNVTYNSDQLVTQYIATYVNANGDILYTEYVDRGAAPIDPVSAGIIPIPTIDSTAQYDFTYTGWDDIASVMLANRTITAIYSNTVRTYTVKWFSRAGLELASKTVEYGSDVSYPGEIPTRTDEEDRFVYNVFAGWDKSTGYITGDINVYAIWTRSELPVIGKDLSEMNVAEIYGIATARKADSYLELKDYCDITLGHDFNFTNVESEVLAENLYLDGTTAYKKEIALFGENERSFTLAIDYQFAPGSENNDTLFSCFDPSGSEGLRLRYSTYPNLQWGETSTNVGNSNYRDIVVIRHIKGDPNLYVYCSNGTASTSFAKEITFTGLTRSRNTYTEASIILGAVQFLGDGGYDYYSNGTIHWCKIWYEDLGDTNARKLASWYRENIRLEFAGSDRFRLTGGVSTKANISFVANNLLSGRGFAMNTSSTSVGGWLETYMKEFCDTRLYDALPDAWKSITKKVEVNYWTGETTVDSVGNTTYTIDQAEGYVYIPSMVEVGSTDSAYSAEGAPISWFNGGNPYTRVKFKGLTIPDGYSHYTSSTDPSATIGNTVKYGDIWQLNGSSVYYIYVDRDTINLHNLSAKNVSSAGGWVSADSWWTRTPTKGYDTYFNYVSGSGNTSLGQANGHHAICIGISV